jgi:hypothetical protein
MVAASRRDDESSAVEQLVPETSFGSEEVPEGQRPVNEYLDMKKAPLFGWASTDSGSQGLLLRLAILYAVTFGLVCYPIAGATFTQEGYLLQKIAAANVGAISLVGALMVRLYSGWSYVGNRLSSKVIEYEETGWYDGDVQTKTETEQKRDKFLFQSEVKPVVDRLKMFGLSLAGIWVASVIGYNVSLSLNPFFDQYDTNILERLSYDDKLADKAAGAAAGKPAYCDSRYYRAIANGGQGCK